jgi:ketosteroid isomerase-like protein
MKKLTSTLCVACAAFLLFGCMSAPPPAANATNVNSNANAKPAAAAPTAAGLLEMEKKAFDAWSKKDGKFFEGFVADTFVDYSNGKRSNRAELIKHIIDNKCEVKSWALSDEKMTTLGSDAAVLTSKAVTDVTCDGQKMPSPVMSSTLFVRSGDTWKAAYHSETPVIDPKAPPPPPTEAKKEEKPVANSNSNVANAPASEPAKPTPSANTEALVKLHQSGWEAFKARDAKWFNDNLASNFALVDPIGTYFGLKADAVKQWTETMKCEGITATKVSDGMATAISPTVEVLTITGNANGTCDGRKNGDLWQTAIYVKEGDAWKLAYMVEQAPM